MVGTWTRRPQIPYSRLAPSTEGCCAGRLTWGFLLGPCWMSGAQSGTARQAWGRVLASLPTGPTAVTAFRYQEPRAATITYNSTTLLRYWWLLDHLPLGARICLQRARRAQIAIHLTSKRVEARATRFGVALADADQVYRSLAIQFTLGRGTAALFSSP